MPLLVALVSLAYLSLLQRNEIILPQAVCGLEKLLVTTEAMVARPKPGGRLSEFLADMRLQRRQQQEEGEMAIYKSQSGQPHHPHWRVCGPPGASGVHV
ncbi:hypothetical protein SRHO_G00333930 [Serrasalmus rhombeus]